MPVDTIYADSVGGRVYSVNAVYLTARSGGGGAVADPLLGSCGQILSGGDYHCIEGFLKFDTSAIPDNATITSATLSLYGSANESAQDFTLVAAIRDWGDTLDAADYVAGASLSALTTVATFASSGWSVAGYNDFTDVALPANISKAGLTRLILYSSREAAADVPSADFERVDWYLTAEVGTSKDPKLTVTYTVPSGIPTVVPALCLTDALTFRFEPVDANNDPVATDLLVDRDSPPTLSWDLWSNHPRTLSGMALVGDEAAGLDINGRLRVWMVAQDGTETSLGHMLYTAAPKLNLGLTTWDGQAGTFRVCALADQSVLLTSALVESISFGSNTRISDAITDLVNLLEWPLGFTITATPQRFAEPVTFRAGQSLASAIDTLCTQTGLLPPQWDRNGAGIIALAPPIDAIFDADHVYDEITEEGWTDDDDMLEAPNTWIATANTPSDAIVSGSYTLPASAPNSVVRTGRVVAVQVEAPGAATVAACEVAARTASLSWPGSTRTVTFSADADYTHDISDTVEWDGLIWREESWSVTLEAGAEMGHTLVRPYEDS